MFSDKLTWAKDQDSLSAGGCQEMLVATYYANGLRGDCALEELVSIAFAPDLLNRFADVGTFEACEAGLLAQSSLQLVVFPDGG